MNNEKLKLFWILLITVMVFATMTRVVYAQDSQYFDLKKAQQDITGSTDFIYGPSGGSNNGGYDNRGYDKRGYYDRRYDKRRYDRQAYEKRKYDNREYDYRGYDKRGYDKRGYYDRRYDKRRYDQRKYDNRGYDNRRYDSQKYDKRKYDNRRYKEKNYGVPPTKYQKKYKNRGYSNAYSDKPNEKYGSSRRDDEWTRAMGGSSTGTAGVGGITPGYGDGSGQGKWRFYPGKNRGWTKDGGRTFQQENPYERPKERRRTPERKTTTADKNSSGEFGRGKSNTDDLCKTGHICVEKGTGRPYVPLLGDYCNSRNLVLRHYCD